MVRTIIHGARIEGRCPNGVQHTGIKYPSYCRGGGGGPKVDRGCWFYRHAVKFFWREPWPLCVL